MLSSVDEESSQSSPVGRWSHRARKKRRHNRNTVAVEAAATPSPAPSVCPRPSGRSHRVVFVLGGPGSGKGAQCSRIAADFPTWLHVNVGDVLLVERKRGDRDLASLLNEKFAPGRVPSDVAVRLVRNIMEDEERKWRRKHHTETTNFLIDGFPRNMDNMAAWEGFGMAELYTIDFVLYLDCSKEVMTERLLGARHRSSNEHEEGGTPGEGIAVDADAARVAEVAAAFDFIRARINGELEQESPVVKLFEERGVLRRINANRDVDEVYQDVSQLFRTK